jgi:hypothetical protein
VATSLSSNRALESSDTPSTSADTPLNKAPLDPALDRDCPVRHDSSDVVEGALAGAIDAEVRTRGLGWEARVALLADELTARRRARERVPSLDVRKRQRGD